MRLDLHPRARWWHMLRDPPTPPVFGPEISFSGPKAREPPANRGDRGRGNQVHVRVFPCNDVKRAEVWPSCPIPQRGSRPAASARLANVRRSVCGVTCRSSISPSTARFSFPRATEVASKRVRRFDWLCLPPVYVGNTGTLGPSRLPSETSDVRCDLSRLKEGGQLNLAEACLSLLSEATRPSARSRSARGGS